MNNYHAAHIWIERVKFPLIQNFLCRGNPFKQEGFFPIYSRMIGAT